MYIYQLYKIPKNKIKDLGKVINITHFPTNAKLINRVSWRNFIKFVKLSCECSNVAAKIHVKGIRGWNFPEFII